MTKMVAGCWIPTTSGHVSKASDCLPTSEGTAMVVGIAVHEGFDSEVALCGRDCELSNRMHCLAHFMTKLMVKQAEHFFAKSSPKTHLLRSSLETSTTPLLRSCFASQSAASLGWMIRARSSSSAGRDASHVGGVAVVFGSSSLRRLLASKASPHRGLQESKFTLKSTKSTPPREQQNNIWYKFRLQFNLKFNVCKLCLCFWGYCRYWHRRYCKMPCRPTSQGNISPPQPPHPPHHHAQMCAAHRCNGTGHRIRYKHGPTPAPPAKDIANINFV